MPDIEKPLKTDRITEVVSAWDAAYIDLEKEEVYELILAANYLDIPSLLALACCKVACMLRGKTPEQIRLEFNISNDLTEAEIARIKEENTWCDDA